jgi:hypothetical protein
MPSKRIGSVWSKAKIVSRIQALRARGTDLSYNSMARSEHGLLAAANYHFGSWGKAVEAAGVDYAHEVRRVPKWSRETIVAAVREAHEQGVDLCWTSVTGDRRYSALAYAAIRENHFGSWDAALKAAGLDPMAVRRYEAWSEERIVSDIRARHKKRRALNSKAMQNQDSKLFNAALNYFGSWDKALLAAGVPPKDVYQRRRWTPDAIKAEIKALHRGGEDLAAPGMRRNHSALYSAACKHFGTWTAAREACGVRRDHHKKT